MVKIIFQWLNWILCRRQQTYPSFLIHAVIINSYKFFWISAWLVDTSPEILMKQKTGMENTSDPQLQNMITRRNIYRKRLTLTILIDISIDIRWKNYKYYHQRQWYTLVVFLLSAVRVVVYDNSRPFAAYHLLYGRIDIVLFIGGWNLIKDGALLPHTDCDISWWFFIYVISNLMAKTTLQKCCLV